MGRDGKYPLYLALYFIRVTDKRLRREFPLFLAYKLLYLIINYEEKISKKERKGGEKGKCLASW